MVRAPASNHGCCPADLYVAAIHCNAAHGDGYGHGFPHCTPFGKYDTGLAEKAAGVFNDAQPGLPAAKSLISGNCTSPATESVWCAKSTTTCACFTYDGNANFIGRARQTAAIGGAAPVCTCPLGDSGDVLWK